MGTAYHHKEGGDAIQAEWMTRIAAGDATALSELYDVYGTIIYSVVYGTLRNLEDAEEVTQEVFVRVWQQAGKYSLAKGSVGAWITTIARRLAIDRTRSRLFKSRTREMGVDDLSTWSGTIDPELENRVGAREVVDALNQLDEKYQEVIWLSHYEGLSHSQIAEKTGAPLGTVKSRIRDAVVALRKILGLEDK